MKCKICGKETKSIFSATVLKKYPMDYYYCESCGFLFPAPISWFEEAYQESINLSDTGLVMRNLYFSKITSVLLYFLFGKNALYLDYAGGTGLFTRLMRDIGFDYYWLDPFTDNIHAKGFEYSPSKSHKIALVTAFECFEHFQDPLAEIEKILSISENIIFSTDLLPPNPPPPQEWDYYAFDHGQHVAFYSKETLLYISKKYKLNFYTCNNLHLFTRKKFPSLVYFLLVKLGHRGLSSVIKFFMNSKTFEDHLYFSGPKKQY